MAKSKDYSVYNARRRAKRLVQRMERELRTGNLSENAQSATRDYISTLNEKIQKSYAPKGYRKWTKEQQQSFKNQVKASLDASTEGLTGRSSSYARQNKVFARQLNLARLGKPSTIGIDSAASFTNEQKLEYNKKQVEIFYQATRQIWRGVDPTKRNEAIVSGLADKGVHTLSEAFDYVMGQNKEVLDRLECETVEGTDGVVANTEEQESFNEELGDDSEQAYYAPTDIVLVG